MKTGLIAALFIITALSCQKEKLKIIEPPLAPTDVRDTFTGTYQVRDTNRITNDPRYSVNTYSITISKGKTWRDTLYLSNIFNSGKTLYVMVKGRNFIIPSQKFVNPYYISGKGAFGDNGSIEFYAETLPNSWRGIGRKN